MQFSVKTGPMVGEHSEVSRANNAETAIRIMGLHGCRGELYCSRLNRLKVGEALRFDTTNNTGVSVERLKNS